MSADTMTRVPDTVAMVVRIPKDLHAELKQLAEANDRSMAAEVRRAIATHIRASGGPYEDPIQTQQTTPSGGTDVRATRPSSGRLRQQVQPIPKGKP